MDGCSSNVCMPYNTFVEVKIKTRGADWSSTLNEGLTIL